MTVDRRQYLAASVLGGLWRDLRQRAVRDRPAHVFASHLKPAPPSPLGSPSPSGFDTGEFAIAKKRLAPLRPRALTGEKGRGG